MSTFDAPRGTPSAGAEADGGPRYAGRPAGNYDLVAVAFCALLLVSNVAATKLIAFGPLITDGGAFLFPLTYILGDVLSEVYGFRAARRTILLGFAISVLAAFVFWLVQISPPAPGWGNQGAFEAVLGFVPRIVAASISAYLIGQLLNSWVLVRIKARTGERRLWVRLIGSTLVGEAADTAVFCTVAFLGVITGREFLTYVLVGYVYKCGIEVVFLPLTYRVVAAVKRREPALRAAG